jgi:hypothetical protein
VASGGSREPSARIAGLVRILRGLEIRASPRSRLAQAAQRRDERGAAVVKGFDGIGVPDELPDEAANVRVPVDDEERFADRLSRAGLRAENVAGPGLRDEVGESIFDLCGEGAEPRVALVAHRGLVPSRVLRERARNRRVEAEAERLELAGGDDDRFLGRQPADDLAEVPVSMDDLRDSRALVEEAMAVPAGALFQLRMVDHLMSGGPPKVLAELIQEHRKLAHGLP